MLLKDILDYANVEDLPEKVLKIDVEKIVIDPKKVKEGDLFLMLKDDEQSQFKMQEALSRGAKLVLCGNDYGIENCYSIRNPRRSFAIMEKKLHHSACDRMKIIGVTGTNGKTTTTHIIYKILKSAGKKVGIIGTLGTKISGNMVETGFTTPDPDILHELFENMEKQGVEYVVMEVSAHALALGKMEGVKFDVAVLTNITQDHLDFFGDMENYQKTKFKIFSLRQARSGVVCADCVNMLELSKFNEIPTISYGLVSPSDVFAIDIKSSLDGSDFICNCNDEVFSAKTRLLGEFNVLNCLAAVATASLCGIDMRDIKRGLEFVEPVDGRLNVLEKNGVQVVIDYAHTPDGLEKIIKTIRPLCKGRLITVFGCGGNRDASKRPIMGKIASELSDLVVLTSDNPRFEDPRDIISDIEKGINRENYQVEPDRTSAIFSALEVASEGDTVIIAGKGAEKTQDIEGMKVPYNDYGAVYDFFQNRALKNQEGKGNDFVR